MKRRSNNQVSIIHGADGPTSIFMLGKIQKKPLKIRIRNATYGFRRKKAEKKIVANPHTLTEVVEYAKTHYESVEADPAARNFMEQQQSLRESLILQHKPELLGEMKDIPAPDYSKEKSVREFLNKIEARSKMIAQMPDHVISMNFHLYEIRIKGGLLEMEIDYTWNIFGISYSGNKKVMKKLKRIARDLYSYYGVSAEDIRNKTERYSTLVTELSS